MKKSYLLLWAFLLLPSVYVYPLDVILTKARMQIQCNIVSQDENTVTYQLLDSQDKELYTIEKADIEKIYPHIEDTTIHNEPKVEPQKEEENVNDVIVLKDGTRIDVALIEVTDKQVKYRKANNPEGPLFIKEIANISSIIYSNGEKEEFVLGTSTATEQSPIREQTLQQNQLQMTNQPQESQTYDINVKDLSLARVEKISGVYVYTDCAPIAEYEVLGEVTVTGYESTDLKNSLGQYCVVRNELIKTAKAANSQVEGVMLSLVTGGVDKAHMIRFKKVQEDHSLARAKRYSGIYVFCDSAPLNKFEYIGNLKGKFTFIPQYSTLRDDFVKKCVKKYKNASGIIIHLVSGGKDSAEAIKF